MDAVCLEHCLTQEERVAFDEEGFFVVEGALPGTMVEELTAVSDRLDAHHRLERGKGPNDSLLTLDFVGKDEIFLELLDWPRTFPKVWGILGWHIQLYHSHLIVTPPVAAADREVEKRLGWHQDSGRLNRDLEGDPRPRVSLKVAFFLTDTSATGSGNLSVVPGSHLRNKLAMPADGVSDPAATTPVHARAGDAVFFDRRLWHSGGRNLSDVTRKVLFYGYSYRWLRPRDDMTVDHIMDRCDPIRRQLLGASASGGMGYTSPGDEDVPLREWIREHQGEEAVVA
jgi:ectoine hydroxylase-related dioxygenase (phytanoyl-CoA dioxygenase family)